MADLNAFDFINAVSHEKKDLFQETEDKEELKKYCPFVTNHSLSLHISSVHDANLMNMSSHLDPDMQFEFYLHGLRKQRRFSKWFKPQKVKDLDMITQVYNCNQRQALDYLQVLTSDQLEQIREQQYTGGKKR